MYNNISNNISTNKFETFTGALNVAPVKVSGNYKIFVDKNLDLYLDDYNNRRVRIDKVQPFLPQVANFLKTPTIIYDNNKLKYGAFRNNKTLSYHTPIYISGKNTLPNYFVLTKALNQTIIDTKDLHKFNDILLLIDLKKIGLYEIFEDIINTYDYILNFNWQDSELKINGYSIIEEVNVNKTIQLLNNQSNQPYLEVVNNKILNTFVNNNIIFPKFINIEFEFQYINNNIPFNNFFGFLSEGKLITNNQFNSDNINVSLYDYRNKIDFKQETNINNVIPINFIDVISISTITKPENKLPQIRLKINNISVGDFFKIYHPDNSIYFEYEVILSDIKPTLRETLRTICIKCTNSSGRNLIFTSDVRNNIIKIVLNVNDNLVDEYYIDVPTNFLFLDKSTKFNNISDSDIIINSTNPENLYESVLINNNFYDVIKTFYFDGQLLLRLSNFNNQIINELDTIEIYENKSTKLLELKPIPYLSFNSDLKSEKQYNKSKYIENLLENFDNSVPEFLIAIEKYNSLNNFEDILPYINDDILIDSINNTTTITTNESNIINIDNTLNNINVLNMMFCSPGCTAYFTPNILNIEKKFYEKNGNLDYRLLADDKIKFHYFLIKSNTPEYLINTISELRYFTDKPKITSRLILSEDNLETCETIFLGVKYRLPQKYKNYQFAIYLDFNNENEIELSYSFDINILEKTIYLKINKYLDFIDLIRGGNINNEPLIDLSFFYCVNYPHNTNSEALYAFKSGGILICDETLPVLYQSNLIENDWKFFDTLTNQWYICLKRSFSVITQPFTEIFSNESEQFVYVYSSVMYNGEIHNYVSMSIKIVGLRILTDDYLWCEDIQVKFFDTETFFINQTSNNPNLYNQIFEVQQTNILSNISDNDNTFYDEQTSIVTIIIDATNQQFKLINPDYEFSLKESYFEFGRKNIYDSESNQTTENFFFKFPEFPFSTWGYNELFNQFDNESLDNITLNSKITLFDRNQIWKLIKDILSVDVKFKHSTPKQTYNLIHELLLSRLADYCELYSLKINNPSQIEDSFIKMSVIPNDENLVIWKINQLNNLVPKIIKINRYHSVYLPYTKIVENELYFQKDISTNFQNSLYNIYDINFAGQNINATGLWKEIQGNVLSSLFTKTSDIIFSLPYPNDNELVLNLSNKLFNIINIEECIINNKNENYISQINNNIDSYIKETYIKWLLLNVYKLDSVKNELGQKIEYNLQINNDYTLTLNSKSTYYTRFENVVFTFSRK